MLHFSFINHGADVGWAGWAGFDWGQAGSVNLVDQAGQAGWVEVAYWAAEIAPVAADALTYSIAKSAYPQADYQKFVYRYLNPVKMFVATLASPKSTCGALIPPFAQTLPNELAN